MRRSSVARFVALSAALHAIVLWRGHDTAFVDTTADALTVQLRIALAAATEAPQPARTVTTPSCCAHGAVAKVMERAAPVTPADPLQPASTRIAPRADSATVETAATGSSATDGAAASLAPAPVTAEVAAAPDHQRALSAIRDRVDQLKNYPLLARRRGWEGHVLLAFVIAVNGDIRDVHVARSSGNAVLDQSALHALNQVRRVPDGLWIDGHSMELELPVVFRLTQS